MLMSKGQSRSGSSEEELDLDDAVAHEDQWHPHDSETTVPLCRGPPITSGQQSQLLVPVQKRRRVTRACDECRRKKIKCDGKQPCTHCTVYSYECTYDQPSNRRRNPPPQYVESLEVRLQRAESVLKSVLPDVDLDDPNLDTIMTEPSQPFVKTEVQSGNLGQTRQPALGGNAQESPDGENDSMLESMVENTGSLDLDDDGYWDFAGHSSGRAFLRRMREQFGEIMGKPDDYMLSPRTGSQLHSPTSAFSAASTPASPAGPKIPKLRNLPAKDSAILLSENCLNDACAVLRFVHQPTYYALLDRVYNTPSESLGSEDIRFLPLLYSVLALGTVFATAEQSQLVTSGFESAIDQGYDWFRVSRSMMDITDCRDLTSLQTMLFQIMFLQCSSRLVTCYSQIGIVLRSSIRMGLHRSIPNKFDPVEEQTRRRIFFSMRKLDTYVGAILGLPQMLNDDDIDQETPLEVDDECITPAGILPMPPGRLSLMSAFNAHTRLVDILSKTSKYIYPIKGIKTSKSHSYIVSHAKIREIEQDLQHWMVTLPEPFKSGGPVEFLRTQHLLRMAYAHIEMYLYRPFLHYVSLDVHATNCDKRAFACAAACVSVSRNIVHLTGEMKRRGLLTGSYWFYMYTTFFAIIALIFYVLENPNGPASPEILKDAYEGKDTLAGLAKRSLAADNCSKRLAEIFEQLPEKLKGVRTSQASQRKRQAQSPLSSSSGVQSAPGVCTGPLPTGNLPRRANTSPVRQQAGRLLSGYQPPSHPRQMNQNIGPDLRRDSQDRFTPTTHSMPQDPYITPNNIAAGHEVPNLSAMMFPSSDPFAYPNQPMTTLENHQALKQQNPLGGGVGQQQEQQPFMNSPTTTTRTLYENLGAPIPHGLPTYVIPTQQQRQQQQQQPGGFDIPAAPMDMSGSGGSGGAGTGAEPSQGAMMLQGNSTWSPLPHQAQLVRGGAGAGAQGVNMDQLFGEDWGGWMTGGYRQ